MPVDNSGALAKTQAIIERLQALRAEAMRPLAQALVDQVLLSTPDPQTEYHALMVGEGGSDYDPPPLAGDRSADDDPKQKGRIRFVKAEGTWLQELNAHPDNVAITEEGVAVGNLAFLVAGSTFMFKDYIPPPRNRRKGQSYPVEAFTSPSYFEAFEYGTAAGGAWTGEVAADGDWRLRPDTDASRHPPGPRTMYKPIVGRFMYSPITLEQVARSFLDGYFANQGLS